jgi:anti-sigma regulatory factor (Ser/Thr protein kinase)
MRTSLDVDIPRDLRAPGHARRAVEDLGPAIADDVRHDVMLLVSELVTNSVKYGAEGGVRLLIKAPEPTRIRVEVINNGDAFEPKQRTRPVTAAGGWGLHLVETLSDRWGVRQGSTHVWFEIDR